MAERLVVALVRGIHGLKGALRIEILSDDPERFEVGQKLFPEGSDAALTIEWSQEDGPGLLVRFEEVDSREGAAGLRDTYLEAAIDDAALPEGAYYWHEIVGVRVVTTEGEDLGTVRDIFRAGGGEVYSINGGPRGEVLVPAIHGVVMELAPREGRIVVDREALGLDTDPPTRKPRGRRTTRAMKAGRPPAQCAPGVLPSDIASDPADDIDADPPSETSPTP